MFAGIVLVAFATLLFELSLIRVLSYTIWHHFGYVTISTALLGFGASGTYLAVRPSLGANGLRRVLVGTSLLSAAAVLGVLCFIVAFPLDPMFILEEPKQLVLFVLYQIVTAVPFFFSGLLVTLILRAGAERVDRLYFWDLLGAGAGCGISVILMNLVSPPGATIVAAAAFAGSAAIFAAGRFSRATCGVIGVALLVASTFGSEIQFSPARSKHATMQLRLLGFEPYLNRWTALFRTDVVEQVGKRTDPFRFPGLSRVAPDEELERPLFFLHHDATAGTGMFDLRAGSHLAHLDYHVLRMPYLVAPPNPEVLVIGVGGGQDVIAAMQYGASHVTGVELDPAAIDLLLGRMNDLFDGFFRSPEITLVAGEGRHFIHMSDNKFDIIQLTGVDTLSAMNSGAYVLAESYLYTAEAFHDYLDHLKPGGVLSFAMANLNPSRPRAAGRLVSVAHTVLRERGVEHPEDYIAAIDSNQLYAEILIRNEPFTPEEVGALAAETSRLAFKPLHLPGRSLAGEFPKLAAATGIEREQLLANSFYLLTPVRDDQPFFLNFFRWSDLLDPGTITPSHSTALGQIVLGMLLLTLTLLAGGFILIPLLFFRRKGIAGTGGARLGVICYFLSIGLGFIMFEISLIQRFVLFLGYPTYSLGITLGALLASTGFGSYLSRRWVGRENVALPSGVLAIALLGVFYTYGLPTLLSETMGTPLLVRALITVAVLVPLGLAMGIFFPLGIRRAASIHQDLIPWAWGINGCASVIGGVLAVVLAISFGFSAVWLISIGIYMFGVTVFLTTLRSEA